MKLTRFAGRSPRPGSILPMLGVCLIGLFGFVALAVDLGMLAVSRTQSQNGADVAALVGTRTLNNKDGVAFNNLPNAVAAAKATATGNPHLSGNFTAAQVTKIEINQYLYNTTSQRFETVEANWVDVTGGGGVAAPGGGSWTAMRVTISVAQPTYFMRIFGVTTMPSGARATAVYRPRDIAFAIDMTGSMAFSCQFNTSSISSTNVRSLNPDPAAPKAGHYASNQAALVATANQTNSTGEAIQRNNYTIATPGGPPIVKNFYFDPTNAAAPATPAFPLTTLSATQPNLKNAFHRWSPPESGGNSDTYTAPTRDWSGYDPTHTGVEASPKGPVPAPDFYGTMTDGVVAYSGDRYRRGDGSINKTNASWATDSAATRAAYHAADLLGYGNGTGGGTPPGMGSDPPFTDDWLNFRDPVWEKYGYDLDVVKYRAQRAGGPPMNPDTFKANNGNSDANILVPAADRYKGYSMGPGYWGKTFFVWPPDPRDPVGNPGDATYQAGDWRRRYFLNKSGGPLDAQADNNSASVVRDAINEVILNTGGGQTFSATAGTQVNYTAILKWVKSGPMVLPPNLRAGRVLYYSSIPDDVNTGTGDTQQRLDKAFWKAYIDFVLGVGSYRSATNLYGSADSWGASPQSISAVEHLPYAFSWAPLDLKRPYMRYTDSPRRPRLHTWFGPLSMLDFLNAVNGNWLPGTCYEAQCWQLKAGVSSVLDDVKNNHPNDYAGMVFFSTSHHNGVRVPMGQNFKRLKNALFYPRSLLTDIDDGNITKEYRPYNTGLGGYNAAEIPNAAGGTDPATGLAYAFNLLSSANLSAGTAVGTGGGRRGAQKIIILETDGVPNNYRVPTFKARGFNSHYTLGDVVGAANGDETGIGHAHDVIRQAVKLTATTSTTSTDGDDSGLSLPNAPARVYPIAFGDLFDEQLAPNATFRNKAKDFLVECGNLGGTGGLPETQIITGPYQQRVTRLRDCLERIFQGGVSVVLVE